MLFDDMNEEEKILLRSICRERHFREGEEIVGEGSAGNALYVIEAGQVAVRKTIDSRHYKRIRELGPSDFFGEVSFLGSGKSRTAIVVALEKCVVLQITRKALAGLVDDHPVIGRKFYENMARDLASRVVVNTTELQEALLWALEGMTPF